MNPLILLDWRLWAGIAVAAALVASHWKVYHLGKAEIRAAWAEERAERNKQSLRIVEKTITDSTELQTQADRITGDKNAQIASLTARAADLDRRVHNRSPRPDSGADLPTPTGDGTCPAGCTGQGLYREDGSFLVGEATDAAILQTGLKACYTQYEDARNKLNAITNSRP